MAQLDPDDLDDADPDEIADDEARRDRDGVASMRDVEAEAGDDDQAVDVFDLDDREARELGVRLDDPDGPEPRLD